MGWIKLHRNILKNSLWLDCTSEQKVIMITLLLMANHEERKISFGKDIITIMPGQFVASLKTISQNCGNGITERKIGTALEKFEKFDFIVRKTSNKFTMITIVNWDVYQSTDVLNVKRMSNECKTDVKPMSINKNIEKEKNDKKYIYGAAARDTDTQCDNGITETFKSGECTKSGRTVFVPPSVEEVREYCAQRKNNVDPEKFVDHYTANGWMRGKSKVKDWKACVRMWEKNDTGKPGTRNKFINYEQKTYTDSEWEEILARKARKQEL